MTRPRRRLAAGAERRPFAMPAAKTASVGGVLSARANAQNQSNDLSHRADPIYVHQVCDFYRSDVTER